jgi:hypothetical protein
MRTIRQNFVECIELLKTKRVVDNLNAVHSLYLDISSIADFDKDPLRVLGYYQKYLIDVHQSVDKVGRWKKFFGIFHAFVMQYKIKKTINKCEKKDFGEGDKYIKEILFLVRKAI